ncbi:MBL fold metallo-hydrolase [Mucilaginibacter myungsuensis]|uniref:MBL fold metallo-hydrolase n=1 Tax=Mucilaginibacter myungsuensis TaxID=649104 RepID=A0A929KZ05_9SPHI|nr:MBL fold metallo-hydrolase [Mucilaginibacter myungsuensis]MBE9661185.1 MBL fold metallo-hydrolase [Mucilaginibacter myungsuensis]MDN3597330.1 MBL fold metallo-hydrolase [Mucilaginibacter myungsuensis]
MKISKYLHSCLVFENDGFKLLIDPGNISFAEGFIGPDEFGDVDAIIITHIHPDHFDMEQLPKIMELSGAPVYTVQQVINEMAKAGLQAEFIPNKVGPFVIESFAAQHELIMDNPLPEMAALVIDGKVLHPVDSLAAELLKYQGIELVLLPIMAPFTNEPTVAKFADALAAKQVLPVHDGFAKPFFLKQRYAAYKKHFDRLGIVFHDSMVLGHTVEV